MWTKLLCIVSADVGVIDDVLMRYFAYIKYMEREGGEGGREWWGGIQYNITSAVYRLEECL
jgi:hypothetical protein